MQRPFIIHQNVSGYGIYFELRLAKVLIFMKFLHHCQFYQQY